jgi:radical SAM protein with 4Fe4S-binding SPASM domain
MAPITRRYGDAAFAFNPQTRASLFVEGSLAPAVLDAINSGTLDPPSAKQLSDYSNLQRRELRQEWEKLVPQVRSFINKHEGQSGGNDKDSDVDAIKELSRFAVRNWQLMTVNLELTSHCNQRCSMCYLDNFSDYGLSQSALRRIARDLRDANALFVLFTGGEVFTRKDATTIMADFADAGFILEIKSNGILLTNRIVIELSSFPLWDVQISIYEPQAGWSDWTHTRYPLNRIESNVRAMVERNLPVTLSVLVGKHNIAQLHTIHKRLSDWGAAVYYSPYITPNRAGLGSVGDYRLSASELRETFGPFLREIGAFPESDKYRDCSAGGDTICFAGRDQIAIGPDGLVYPCLDLRVPLGDLKFEDIETILSRRKQVLEAFRFREMSICKACEIVDFCDSCIGVALVENEDYRIPSLHKCDISHFYNTPERS